MVRHLVGLHSHCVPILSMHSIFCDFVIWRWDNLKCGRGKKVSNTCKMPGMVSGIVEAQILTARTYHWDSILMSFVCSWCAGPV